MSNSTYKFICIDIVSGQRVHVWESAENRVTIGCKSKCPCCGGESYKVTVATADGFADVDLMLRNDRTCVRASRAHEMFPGALVNAGANLAAEYRTMFAAAGVDDGLFQRIKTVFDVKESA